MKNRSSNKCLRYVVMVVFMATVFVTPHNASAKWRPNSEQSTDDGGSGNKALVAAGAIGVLVGLIYFYMKGKKTGVKKETQEFGKPTPTSNPVKTVPIASLLSQMDEKKLRVPTVFSLSNKTRSSYKDHGNFNAERLHVGNKHSLHIPRFANHEPDLKSELQALKR